MDRKDVILELKKYFKIQELVCPHTYEKWKDSSWNFLDTDLLTVLLILRRDILKVPFVINDYVFKGKNTQRGIRCNCCQLVKSKSSAYLSMHIFGKAFDIVSAKMSATQMRALIKANATKLPCNVRIESNVSWLHIDVMDMDRKIYEF